jgi:hypothetical protein
LLQPGDALTFMGVPPGDGPRFGGDRDANGTLDADEPAPALSIESVSGLARLRWPQAAADWFPEATAGFSTWTPLNGPRSRDGVYFLLHQGLPQSTSAFFRLRRTW